MLHRQAINVWLSIFDHELNIKYFHVECVVVCAETNCCVTKTLSLTNLPLIGMVFCSFLFLHFVCMLFKWECVVLQGSALPTWITLFEYKDESGMWRFENFSSRKLSSHNVFYMECIQNIEKLKSYDNVSGDCAYKYVCNGCEDEQMLYTYSIKK